MALVYCSDCGKEISTSAKSCPNCGKPAFETKEPRVSPPPKKMRLWKKILIGFVAFLAVGVIVEITKSPEQKAAEEQARITDENRKTEAQNAIDKKLLAEQEAITALIRKEMGVSKVYGAYRLQIMDYTEKGGKVILLYEKGPISAEDSEVLSGVAAMLSAKAIASLGRSPSQENINIVAGAYYPQKGATETRPVNPHGVSKYNPKTDKINWLPGENTNADASTLYKLLNN